MRFGGHETFPVREEWIPKGLRLVADQPDAFADPLVCDELGVGRNMAKSIRFWLKATGLVVSKKGTSELELTPIGQLVREHDPYLLRVGTWWALHANLVNSDVDAEVWSLFFGRFGRDWFDREACYSEILRMLDETPRPPTEKTLGRDIACLLSSYAVSIPAVASDAEDGRECPFRSLEIVRHMVASDSYRTDRSPKKIPPELLGYVISLCADSDETYYRTSLAEALTDSRGPGRVLVLDTEGLVGLLGVAEQILGSDLIQTSIEGGERIVRIRNLGPEGWLERYYGRRPNHALV